MLTKILKWAGILLVVLVLLAALLIGGLYAWGNARLTKKYEIQVETVAIPSDQASIERGKEWAATFCAHCHGSDFSGLPLVNDPSVGYVPASNLTPGEGGAGSEFTDVDWVRAIRHGVDPEGGALIAMPSQNYSMMNDQDLGDLIAYMKSLPSVDHDLGEPNMSFMSKILLAAGAFGKTILPAEVIDHSGARPAVVEPGVTVEYGGYLVRLGGCRDCHGEDLSGGKSPEPGSPYAPDLTPGGAVGQWSKGVFIAAVHTMKGIGMPWDELRPLADPDLEAMYMFLQSLPAK